MSRHQLNQLVTSLYIAILLGKLCEQCSQELVNLLDGTEPLPIALLDPYLMIELLGANVLETDRYEVQRCHVHTEGIEPSLEGEDDGPAEQEPLDQLVLLIILLHNLLTSIVRHGHRLLRRTVVLPDARLIDHSHIDHPILVLVLLLALVLYHLLEEDDRLGNGTLVACSQHLKQWMLLGECFDDHTLQPFVILNVTLLTIVKK